MKKRLFLFVLLLTILWTPLVFALDIPDYDVNDFPQDGVAYFMYYPNGAYDATDDYTVAKTEPEKHVLTDVTNQSGIVSVCGFEEAGSIRVLQHVPDGYTTRTREVTIDLSNNSGVSFVDYRGGNPGTGRTYFMIIGLLVLIGFTAYASYRKKKALMMIPIVLSLLAIPYGLAHEDSSDGEESALDVSMNCFDVRIVDGEGTPLKDVQVDIFAKPVFMDYGPAVKFSANGGYFFDGSEVMIIPLPGSPMASDDFMNIINQSYLYQYFRNNAKGAYREGYYPDGFDFPDTLENGMTIPMIWKEDEEATLIKLDGNGGKLFYDWIALDFIYLYEFNTWQFFAEDFINKDSVLVGYDTNPSCSHVKPIVVHRSEADVAVSKTYYLCWNEHPDGLYINDKLVSPGNYDDCYHQNYPEFDSYQEQLTFWKWKGEGYYSFYPSENNFIVDSNYDRIYSISIVEDGETILYLDTNDLEATLPKTEYGYKILNETKKEQLMDYFDQLISHCYSVFINEDL